jgi:hypothetical protein
MGEKSEERAPEVTGRLEQQRHTTEFAAAILLAFSSVVTSWSGYQASLWSGIQSTNYNQANALRVESARESTKAGQQVGLDIALFMSWVNAKAAKNEGLADFYSQRFRPEFHQFFDAWLAAQPLSNPQAPRTPFDLPGYHTEHGERARDLESQSKALFEAGHRANHTADTYVLGTVLLATVLFFCGIVQQFKELRTRVFLLSIAVLLLLFGLSKILVLPRAT